MVKPSSAQPQRSLARLTPLGLPLLLLELSVFAPSCSSDDKHPSTAIGGRGGSTSSGGKSGRGGSTSRGGDSSGGASDAGGSADQGGDSAGGAGPGSCGDG